MKDILKGGEAYAHLGPDRIIAAMKAAGYRQYVVVSGRHEKTYNIERLASASRSVLIQAAQCLLALRKLPAIKLELEWDESKNVFDPPDRVMEFDDFDYVPKRKVGYCE